MYAEIKNSEQNLTENIGFMEKFAYGCGDLASNLVYGAMTSFLVFFYTDISKVSAAAIGSIMLISRILDGLVDIVMGILVDKTKSKHGKARPWLLRMSIPFAISAVLMFTVPEMSQNAKLVYIFITYNLVNIIYTSINIPYGVLNSLMTQDQYQRSVLNIFRMILSTVGSLSISMLTLPVVKALGNDARAWTLTFTIFGAIAAVLFFFTFFFTKERVKPAGNSENKNNIPVKVGVKALFKNKYWAIMVVFLVITFVSMTAAGGVTVYYAQYILGDASAVGTLSFANVIPMMICMMLSAPIIKKYGKRNATLVGLAITAIGYLIMMMNTGSLTFLLAGSIIKGIGSGPLGASMFAMVADTIEYGEWKTGIRNEGMVYSAASFGLKVGGGLGAAILGWILAFGGYVGDAPTQSASAIFAIKNLFLYIPLAIILLQAILLSMYKLDKEYPSIIKELQSRR